MTKEHEQRDLFPGALEMMVLRTLKRQPLHGYALAQYIKRTSDNLLEIEEGSLYPALQRLLKEELLKAREAVWRAFFNHDQAALDKLIPAELITIEARGEQFGNRQAVMAGSEAFALRPYMIGPSGA